MRVGSMHVKSHKKLSNFTQEFVICGDKWKRLIVALKKRYVCYPFNTLTNADFNHLSLLPFAQQMQKNWFFKKKKSLPFLKFQIQKKLKFIAKNSEKRKLGLR